MSGVYIKDMEMPINPDMAPTAVWVYPNGYAVVFKDNGKMQQYTQAVPVPAHGRLIDADSKTFPTLHRNPSNDYMKGWNACLRSVQQQPIIIPEGEGET